jgi:putative membrane protein
MFDPRSDSVSNIHKRWSLTRLNPSSYKLSFLVSILSTTTIIIICHSYILKTDWSIFVFHLLLGLLTITGANFLDFFLLQGTPNNKITKVCHVSAFANLLWVSTVLLGIASDILLSKNETTTTNYIVEGMFLAIGLRIGIFTSVFGATIRKAITVSFISPLLFLFAFLPITFYFEALTTPMALSFGSSLLLLGITWTIFADRSGRPGVKSTFRVLQAFLAAWTENKADNMEEIAESRAHIKTVITYILKFKTMNSDEVFIILPDIHPGPFNPIGGSDLPYVLYKFFSKNAMVMHSVSGHYLNIPSKKEVDKYVKTLSNSRLSEAGTACTNPVQIKIGKCTVTGIAFGQSVIVFLSMAPKGMDDVPEHVRTALEHYSSQIGFHNILIIDTHNALGDSLNQQDSKIMISTAEHCLNELKHASQHEFKIGFANSDELSYNIKSMQDLGHSGLSSLLLLVGEKAYFIGWADSNNMDNDLRNYIISQLNNDRINMLEICTSDTHSTSGKRNRQGYYTFGNFSRPEEIAKIYLRLSRKSIEKASPSTFELLSKRSAIKVMGKNQFKDYSIALDKSMNITKLFLVITLLVFIGMLILS